MQSLKSLEPDFFLIYFRNYEFQPHFLEINLRLIIFLLNYFLNFQINSKSGTFKPEEKLDNI